VACPGFAADCLETLEEIHLRLEEGFRAAGGRELVVAPCLNAHPEWVRALAGLARGASAAVPAHAERT
jgi:protoporphyrin/coproporphyrin ferrochelatase